LCCPWKSHVARLILRRCYRSIESVQIVYAGTSRWPERSSGLWQGRRPDISIKIAVVRSLPNVLLKVGKRTLVRSKATFFARLQDGSGIGGRQLLPDAIER
jgi:hypothetical protein